MDVATFASHVQALPFGKKLPRATYVYAPKSSALPTELAELIQRLRDDLGLASEFNVVKFSHDGGVSFLKYPGFHELPHPELRRSYIAKKHSLRQTILLHPRGRGLPRRKRTPACMTTQS